MVFQGEAMLTILYLGLGLGTGFLFLCYVKVYGRNRERRLFSSALLIAALIYVGFALLFGNMRWLLIELLGVPAYFIFAFAAARFSVYWLALGWALHPLWDAPLHLMGSGTAVVPEWYAVACISFDLLLAVYILKNAAHWQRRSYSSA